MKIFLMLSLLKLGLVALYIYIQNVHQAKDLEVLKQSIIARDKEDGKQYEEDILSQKKVANLILNMANQTLSAIEKLYGKVIQGMKHPLQSQLENETMVLMVLAFE